MRLSFPPRRRSMRACWGSDRIMTHLNYLGTIITRQMAELAYRPARGACYRLGAMIFLVLLQRWEKREQLPVRRHFHSKNGTVYAFRREIDEWRESRCVLLNGRRWRNWFVAWGMFKAQHIGILTSLPQRRLHLKERLRRESARLHAWFSFFGSPVLSSKNLEEFDVIHAWDNRGRAAQPSKRATLRWPALCGFVFCKGWDTRKPFTPPPQLCNPQFLPSNAKYLTS